jgi:predicted metalloprotease
LGVPDDSTLPEARDYGGPARSICGQDFAAGPFYCEAEHQVFWDREFANQLEGRVSDGYADAETYLRLHALAHYVQANRGTMRNVERDRSGLKAPGERRLAMRVELQADCFVGLYYERTLGETQAKAQIRRYEATLTGIRALMAESLAQASETPPALASENWQAASMKQRLRWFSAGIGAQTPEACQTFGHSDL